MKGIGAKQAASWDRYGLVVGSTGLCPVDTELWGAFALPCLPHKSIAEDSQDSLWVNWVRLLQQKKAQLQRLFCEVAENRKDSEV